MSTTTAGEYCCDVCGRRIDVDTAGCMAIPCLCGKRPRLSIKEHALVRGMDLQDAPGSQREIDILTGARTPWEGEVP